jgi:NADH-quinone oxidoreductase subunit L
MGTVAWIIPVSSIVAFLIVALGQNSSRKLPLITLFATIIGFIAFIVLSNALLQNGTQTFEITWLKTKEVMLIWGITLDPLTVTMLGLITLTAAGVQMYSLVYMKNDSRFNWYFAVHSLFLASMITLVLANNLILIYIAWELVGVCSYLLIGFWWEKRSAAEAAKKAFITTRIGDVGLLIGIILLFTETHTFNLSEIFSAASDGEISQTTITFSTLLILLGALGKSAQFPFHVWLPDAMEGPTPVSALIHAATMVVAGVYLIARCLPLFELSEISMTILLVLASITALLGGVIALVMTDLKKILAYSTITDLAFMMIALSCGGIVPSVFHLIIHGFAKAALFLGAGSITHGSGETDIRKLGGLKNKMPVTALCFSLSSLSLIGIPPLGGFFSKEGILEVLNHEYGIPLLLIGLLIAFLKACYLGRLSFFVFFGKESKSSSNAHESPKLMLLPIMLFTTLTTLSGLLLFSYGKYDGFSMFLNQEAAHAINFLHPITISSILVSLIGLLISWNIAKGKSIPGINILMKSKAIQVPIRNLFYIDNIYQWFINAIILSFGRIIALIDRQVVNDKLVDGTASILNYSSRTFRYLQTGKMYNYALGMTFGVAGLAVLNIIWQFIL